jgi:hypothetical protein
LCDGPFRELVKLKVYMIVSLRMAALVGCLALLSACDRHIQTEKEMTWDCKPDRYYDGLQWVEFRFVENPNYFDTEVGPRLCDALKSLGRSRVVMKFDLLGDFVSGFRGQSTVGIDGLSTPFADRDAGVESFGTAGPGVDPLKTTYDRLASK